VFRGRLLLAAIVLLVLAALAIAAAEDAAAAGQCAVSDPGIDDQEREFVRLINEYRAEAGLGTLTVSTTLTRAAAWMATDLAGRDVFAHNDSLGRTAHVRIADCGYAGPAGENLAAGKTWESAARALRAWQESADHNRNMLYPSYRQIGVARIHAPGSQYGWYWVTTFGTVDDGTDMLRAQQGSSPGPVEASAGAAAVLELKVGANLVSWPGREVAVAEVAAQSPAIVAVYAFDAATNRWLRYAPGAPGYASLLVTLKPGGAYWILTRAAVELTVR
jgi:uncharacterized protein YkwD